MKKRSMIVVFLFTVVWNTKAQQQIKPSYNFETLVSLTSATQKQQKQLKTALKERNQDTTSGNEDKYFYKHLESIFNKEQQNAFYKAQMSEAVIQKKMHFRYDKLIDTYPFPKEYAKLIEETLYDFNYKKEFTVQKYKYDKESRELAYQSIDAAQKKWVSNQIQLIKTAKYSWKKTILKCPELPDVNRTAYISYHFYLQLLKKGAPIQHAFANTRITELKSSKDLQSIINSIIDCRAELYLSYDTRFENLDSISKNEAKKVIVLEVSNKLNNKLENTKDLYLNGIEYKTGSKAIAAAKKQQEKSNKTKELEILNSKAVKIGLTQAQIDKLVLSLERKDAAIAALKNHKKNSDLSTLFETTPSKTKSEILKEFSKELTEILSKKEFAALFGDGFRPIAKKKASKEFQEITTKYKQLDQDQKQELYKIIILYYFNIEITNAYYKSKSTLRKQKLSVLRYRFEKEYITLMESFDIKIKTSQKTDNRTFQW